METELAYLLEELDNWADNDVITVEILKKMINGSFKKAAKKEYLQSFKQVNPELNVKDYEKLF